MLQSKVLKTSALLLAALVSLSAQAAKQTRDYQTLLKSPGAHELMDDEAALWQRGPETKRLSVARQTGAMGSIVIRGTPSPAQRFNRGKLIRCEPRQIGGGQVLALRNSCDVANPTFVPLSANGVDQPTQVAPGFYVLGFENSVFPGFLQIVAGQQTAIDLAKIEIPAGGDVKVYRDLTNLTEQFKMYFTTYVLGQSVFRLSEYSFGDLYVKSFGTRDGTVPFSYRICEAAKRPELTSKGERICRAWNMGSFMSVTELFEFGADGGFNQYELGNQGKPYAYKQGRLLVAKRTNSSLATFVNVLPGQYVVEVTDEKGAVTRTQTGTVGSPTLAQDLTKNLGWVPAASKLKMVGGDATLAVPVAIDPAADPNAPSAAVLAATDDGDAGYVDPNETCGSAKLWRTEMRSYCTADTMAGCNRSQAKVCEPMSPISLVP